MPINIKKITEFTGHTQPVYTLEAAPEQGCFFSAGGDKTIVKWNIDTPDWGTPIAQFKFTVYSLCCLVQKNILLAGTSEGGIHIIDLTNNTEIKYYKIPDEGVFDIKYSFEHNVIVASTARGKLFFISPINYSVIGEMVISKEKIRNITFNPNRPYLYAACSNSNVYVIDVANRELIHSFEAHQWATNALFYHPEKDELITASKDAHIRVWDIKEQFELIKNIPAHNYAIYKIAYNSHYHFFATAARDKTIKIWDDEFNIIARIDKDKFEGHTNSVNSILWLNKSYLLSTGDDRRIILWEVTIN